MHSSFLNALTPHLSPSLTLSANLTEADRDLFDGISVFTEGDKRIF